MEAQAFEYGGTAARYPNLHPVIEKPLLNPLTVKTLSHMPGKEAMLMCLDGL